MASALVTDFDIRIIFAVRKYRNALDASDLVSLFHELALFDDPKEKKINTKDVICQEFIDRIGKLYKPVLMEQVNIYKLQFNRKVINLYFRIELECASGIYK